MIVIDQYQSVEAAIAHVEPLLLEHYEEVASKVYTLDPDWSRYRLLAANRQLLMLLAFKADRCIGYSVSVLSDHLHYRRDYVAYNDVLFVAKEHRHTSAGGRLMVQTQYAAKAAGARVMQWHAKPGTALDDVLSKRVPLFENVYQETL